MSDCAHPAGYACPDGPAAECPGCGARDCPHGEPLHHHHDGCPACYLDFLDQHGRRPEAEDGGAGRPEDEDDRLEAEAFSLRLGAQIADPADLAALESLYGLRPGARGVYPHSGDGWRAPDTFRVLDLVRRRQEKALGLDDFVYALSGVVWGVCGWGSCQYATAFAMFRALQCLQRAGLDPTKTMGWGGASDLTRGAAPVAAALAAIAEEIGGEGLAAGSLRGRATLDEAFGLMREDGWDLWSAASHAAQLVFGTDFHEVEANIEASPGVGPSDNVLAQSDNYTTALRCYLLLEAGYVANPDSAFAGFST